MSTRSHIQVQQGDGSIYPCMIYKHSDGDPDSMMAFLVSFAQAFVKDRGDDAEYCVAQILRHWAFEDFKYYNTPKYKKMFDGRNLALEMTGWGVCLSSDVHGDIEYMYTVNLKDGTVTWKTA